MYEHAVIDPSNVRKNLQQISRLITHLNTLTVALGSTKDSICGWKNSDSSNADHVNIRMLTGMQCYENIAYYNCGGLLENGCPRP